MLVCKSVYQITGEIHTCQTEKITLQKWKWGDQMVHISGPSNLSDYHQELPHGKRGKFLQINFIACLVLDDVTARLFGYYNQTDA